MTPEIKDEWVEAFAEAFRQKLVGNGYYKYPIVGCFDDEGDYRDDVTTVACIDGDVDLRAVLEAIAPAIYEAGLRAGLERAVLTVNNQTSQGGQSDYGAGFDDGVYASIEVIRNLIDGAD